MNDIHTSIKHCNINLFADDTLLSISSRNINEAVQKLNIDLQSLSLWLKQNKLKLNITKTKYMIIGRKHCANINIDQTIQIDTESIERVTNFKYLGIVIDDQLRFNTHIQHIVKQTAKKIGILYRANRQLTTRAKFYVYSSIIKPHFLYCPTILFLCKPCDIDKLQKQQNKVMRLLLKCPYDSHIADMLAALNWLSVKQLIYMNVFLFIYKMQHNLLPKSLCQNIIYIHQHHNINTRSRNKLRLTNMSKSSTQNSLYYKGFQLYNNIPETIKMLNTTQFKKHINQYIKTCFPHI